MEQQKEKSIKVYLIFIIFIILSLGIGSYIKKEWDTDNRVKETSQVSSQDINSYGEVRSTLESKISFPKKEILTTKEVNISSIKEINKFFILEDNQNLKISEEVYADGSDGLSISYLINQDMKNVYITMRNNVMREGFSTTSATRANLGALLLVEDESAIQKTYLLNVKAGETKVDINIINK